MEGTFGEGVGIEGRLYRGWRGWGEDADVQCEGFDLVEGEACAVWGGGRAVGVMRDRFQVAGGYAGFEYQVSVSFGDAAAVIEDG